MPSFTRSKAFADARELADHWIAYPCPATRRDTLQRLVELIEADRPAGVMTLLAFVHWMPQLTPAMLVDELQARLWPDIA